MATPATDTFPLSLHKLLAEFACSPGVRSSDFKEDWVRAEYIEPLFEGLGWARLNPALLTNLSTGYVREIPLGQMGSAKAPDYGFYVAGRRTFYAEAKKPSVNIKTDEKPAYQIRDYGWSATDDIGVLTDFEEFAIYNCRLQPQTGDSPRVGLIDYFTAAQYEDKWEWLVQHLTPEAVKAGSLGRLVGNYKATKKHVPVDAAFLREIEDWRGDLAEDIISHNELSPRALNTQVQGLIDRIIFLRIAEARGLEADGTLRSSLDRSPIYRSLRTLFELADTRYNSGLFHFRQEKGRGTPDLISSRLVVSDEVLRSMIDRLTSDDSPYRFSVIPTDILGQIYERFLGREIHIRDHHAVVEEKPEYRRSGGVYYTPSYVVDYIVDLTLKPLLAGKSVAQARLLKVVDPSCGSGSFLIAAYQYLLDWHQQKYAQYKRPVDRARFLMTGIDGRVRLRLEERKRILLDNIYGVDIDAQAVEVAKLSLLLKVIEGETQTALAVDRLLPDLDANIVCGNSLIGTDFYPTDELINLTPDEAARVNALDWSAAFSDIAEKQGFDAVIGNPPWLMAGYYVPESMDYFHRVYETCTGKADLYYLFLEKSLRLITPGGRIGMIVPSKFFHTAAAKQLRAMLVAGSWIQEIVDFGTARIFADAVNYSCILTLCTGTSGPITVTRAGAYLADLETFSIDRSSLTEAPWHLIVPDRTELWARIRYKAVTLESLAPHFGNGVQTGADPIFIMSDAKRRELGIEAEACRPILKGKSVRDFSAVPQHVVLFPYEIVAGAFSPIPEAQLQQRFPVAYDYLDSRRARLEERVWFKKGPIECSGAWYGMMYLDDASSFAGSHLVTPALSDRSNFAISHDTLFVTGTAGVSSVVLETGDEGFLFFILGVLNSTLLSEFIVDHSTPYQGGYVKFSAPYIRRTPIRLPNAKVRSSRVLASDIADLAKSLASPTPGTSAATLQTLKRRLDEHVLRLYEVDASERVVFER